VNILLQVPKEVSLGDIRSKGFTWSPAMYRTSIIPTSKVKLIRDLLVPSRPFDKGVEPGSIWYMRSSHYHLVRTKALQDDSCLIYPKGDAIEPMNPRAFVDFALSDGDILMSKDSNVGTCAIVDGDGWKRHMFSGGILRLHPSIDRYYFFSFLKHPLFKSQLESKVPRGATIAHAKSLWLDCVMPFPNQRDDERAMRYVSALMQAIIDKERAIRAKNRLIDETIATELLTRQKGNSGFRPAPVTIDELRAVGRLDAPMFVDDFKRKQFLITNYVGGCATYEDLGFEINRGQNLQVSCIGKSIYSDVARAGFYRLAAPSDLSEYRTVRQFRFLGNKKRLALLKKGDVVFGAEGFCKGRTVILADEMQNTLTNIHGIILHPKDGDAVKGIFLGCFLGYIRNERIVDAISAGGSGGSLAIGYFHHLRFPRFPRNVQENIARLYHNPASPPDNQPTLQQFVSWHRLWNDSLGIWELDREMKVLRQALYEVQGYIIDGKAFNVPLADGEH
jgi:hypothetical protein